MSIGLASRGNAFHTSHYFSALPNKNINFLFDKFSSKPLSPQEKPIKIGLPVSGISVFPSKFHFYLQFRYFCSTVFILSFKIRLKKCWKKLVNVILTVWLINVLAINTSVIMYSQDKPVPIKTSASLLYNNFDVLPSKNEEEVLFGVIHKSLVWVFNPMNVRTQDSRGDSSTAYKKVICKGESVHSSSVILQVSKTGNKLLCVFVLFL